MIREIVIWPDPVLKEIAKPVEKKPEPKAPAKPDNRLEQEVARDGLIHTIGNLTLLTGPMNGAQSNRPWQATASALAAPLGVPTLLPP